jgi:hypothetical protein
VLQAVPGELALQPVIAGRYRHTYAALDGPWRFTSMHITIDLVGDLGSPHALRSQTMRLSLSYSWECAPEAFWALYYDPAFVVRLHLEGLGSISAEVVSQEGDLASGLTRTLRYGQKPNAPGPVRKIFGEEITSTEVSTFNPATSTTIFTHHAGHHGRQDPD